MAEDKWAGIKRKYTIEELCETVFYLSRYAECLEIDRAITVPDERELFWMILDWAREFEQKFDPAGGTDHLSGLETQGVRWLLDNFPYVPEMETSSASDMKMPPLGM